MPQQTRAENPDAQRRYYGKMLVRLRADLLKLNETSSKPPITGPIDGTKALKIQYGRVCRTFWKLAARTTVNDPCYDSVSLEREKYQFKDFDKFDEFGRESARTGISNCMAHLVAEHGPITGLRTRTRYEALCHAYLEACYVEIKRKLAGHQKSIGLLGAKDFIDRYLAHRSRLLREFRS
ncbi:MAG: hypothetical protein V1495_03385, partial [Pseudomonadota bacterium]